ncbi:MAG: KAP family NTPase [candidate division Zixibacteria bacterium]|nr:KAP family NTPase [candidate division Zixibacteria bacterium]
MTSDNSPRVVILSDRVADEDELGSHQSIADSIADLISSDQDGRSIALTGSWGSGKSSVVEMLKQKLGGDTRLFLYNAWAHERDPLHRSFLERLGDFLSETNWISCRNWIKKRAMLAKKRETTRTTHNRKPTVAGVFFGLSVFLSPIGLVLLNQLKWDGTDSLCHQMGSFLSILPILVGLVCLGLSYCTKDEDKQKRLRSVLSTDSSDTTTNDTYRTPEPTAIEFRRYYGELLAECLHIPERRLVIVVDNLDRLDAPNALAVWSTMKTFLENSSIDSETWSGRVWLIVPFAPTAAERLWNGDTSKGKENGDAAERSGRGGLAVSFIEKTFQVSFHVPAPVLSNWEEYFMTMLRQALPDEKDDERLHLVGRVFSHKKVKGVEAPTPREIKVFINRVGALYRQWHSDIKLPVLALYAAIENDKGLVEKLRTENESIAGQVLPPYLGDDYLRLLAAVHYNVQPDEADHVLLGPKLVNIIESNQAEEFSKMRALTGFEGVLERSVEERVAYWITEDRSTIAWLACQLDDGGEMGRSARNTWDILCRTAKKVGAWQYIDEHIGMGLVQLLKHWKEDSDFAAKVLDAISMTEPEPAEDDQTGGSVAAEPWLKSCALVQEWVLDRFGSDIVSQHFRCPGDAKMYLAIVSHAIDGGFSPSLIGNLRPKVPASDIVEEITKVVADGKYSATMRKVVENLAAMKIGCPWESLTKAAFTRTQAPNELEPEELAALLGTLKDLESFTQQAPAGLTALATKAHIFHHIHTMHGKQHSPSMALCLYLILKYNANALVATARGNSANGVHVFNDMKVKPSICGYALDDLITVLIGAGETSLLIGSLAEDKSVEPLRLELVRRLAQREDILDLVPVQDFVSQEIDFYNALRSEDATYQTIVNGYIRDASLIDSLVEESFVPGLASLYCAVLLSPDATNEKYSAWLVSKLRQVSENRWVSELDAVYCSLYDLLASLRTKDVEIGLEVQFRNALRTYIDKLNAGSPPNADLGGVWTDMLGSLDEDYRKTFISETIDNMIDASTSYAKTIQLFGAALLDCERLNIAKDNIIQKGFTNFIKYERIDELHWFSNVIKECPDVLKKARRENRKTFKGEVANLLAKGELEEEILAVLSEIGETIGVKPANDKKEDTSESE